MVAGGWGLTAEGSGLPFRAMTSRKLPVVKVVHVLSAVQSVRTLSGRLYPSEAVKNQGAWVFQKEHSRVASWGVVRSPVDRPGVRPGIPARLLRCWCGRCRRRELNCDSVPDQFHGHRQTT